MLLKQKIPYGHVRDFVLRAPNENRGTPIIGIMIKFRTCLPLLFAISSYDFFNIKPAFFSLNF